MVERKAIYTSISNGFRKLFALNDPRSVNTCEIFLKLKHEDWNDEKVRESVECLSHLITDPTITTSISFCFPQFILDILSLTLSSNISHQLKCVLLGNLVHRHPDVIKCCMMYFKCADPPWTVVSDCQRMKKRKVQRLIVSDLEIVRCCLSLVLASLQDFSKMWNWSEFIFKYISHSDRQVAWVAVQCSSLVLYMNENQKINFIKQLFNAEEIKEYSLLFDKKGLNFSFEHDISINCGSIVEESQNFSYTALSISENVVNVGGIALPVYNSKKKDMSGFLVSVKSTLSNLRNVAIGIATNKAVCLTGPVGCGKTTLVEHLAQITGRTNTNGFFKVQLGEETDSKMLLGSYRCTDIPGEFIWQPGVLTKAVLDGYWLLLEDIDSATSDVAAVLANLLENNSLSIPGFRDNVTASPGFQLFVTHRLISSLGGTHRKQTTAIELLEKHWLLINCEPLTRNELIFIVQTKFSALQTIASKMIAVYMHFSTGNHDDMNSRSSLLSGGRLTSTRDLLKWCTRSVIDFEVSSHETALKVLQDAIDVFCCSYSCPDQRLEFAKKIAACLGIINTKAEYFCLLHKPSIAVNTNKCKFGRVSLLKKDSAGLTLLNNESHRIKFAYTLTSCSLMERIAVCISLSEPVLLVGETGTGKTSTLQLLAKSTGHNLVVVNMNQQSDSADLLGGYKPVDLKFIISPIRDEFETLFRSFFKVQENLKFLEHISVCFSQRKWPTLLKLIRHSQTAAVKRLAEHKDSLNCDRLTKWRNLGEKVIKLQAQLNQGQAAMAFSFIEGSLIHAIKKGYWVLLDEINLASAETLQCLSGLLEGSSDSVFLLEKGEDALIKKHPDFRLMAAMNPATDVGKKELPSGIRNRFTELFVTEHTEKSDLRLVVSCYLQELSAVKVEAVVNFYLSIREKARICLADATGHKPHFSLRTLCRALVVAAANLCGSVQRSLYEALCLSFLTQLDAASHTTVENMIARTVMEESDIKSVLKKPIPEPPPHGLHVCFEGFWVSKGDKEPHIPDKYLVTPSVRRNLRDLARCVSLSNHPVLIQGETSVGKTSLIAYLAQASGHTFLRINNHQHTDLQEYVGSYCADPITGNLVFQEGVLVQAMRNGYWIILDELNLAPCEVLEALNRVLDDNRELYIAETQKIVKAHQNFRLFATQNPPGLYGGRKMLSRAFRNRFVELHFDEIPAPELENILQHRCQMPMSYCKKLVSVMTDLQVRRKGSAAFAGKQGFITLRDLFRWGERYRLANQDPSKGFYDWDQHLADEGYLVLAGRVRKEEECETIRQVIQQRIKRKVDVNKLFTSSNDTSTVTKNILQKLMESPLPDAFSHIVWTFNLRKLAVITGKALEFHEPVLLVGDTGCGKTTICQLLTTMNKQNLFSINCHQHSESSDFLGGLRPVREREDTNKLFEWVDGPLIKAMRSGEVFLADEISLADDSVLERLNSLLEPERKLLISEKGYGEDLEVVANEKFRFIGTMNPGGDFGKKELSPALRNRFTEIWCEGPDYNDIIAIMEHNIRPGLSLGNQEDGSSGIGKVLVHFVKWFLTTDIGKRITVSIRDILTWVKFINITTEESNILSVPPLEVSSAYVHGGCLTIIDGIGSASTSTDCSNILNEFKCKCVKFLLTQVNSACGGYSSKLDDLLLSSKANLKVSFTERLFGIKPFYILKGSSPVPLNQDFFFDAPTTCINALRVLRSLQIPTRAILLEGSPGVGKTSLVTALAKASGYQVTRINLSEQTDISDLFGADLPVEGAPGGTFAWRDGPFLKALKNGHWILLDELNLASQSVVEGLNSVLDHRGEIFIPELGKVFRLKNDSTKIFACQNPQRQGGARKGLPQSFLNRFTQVFMEVLTKADLKLILSSLYPKLSPDVVKRMVEFNEKLTETNFLSRIHWEWNLRDLSFWAETMQNNDPGSFAMSIYGGRMRDRNDKLKVMKMYEEIFGDDYPLVKRTSPLMITPTSLTLGHVTISRTANESNNFGQNAVNNVVDKKNELLVLRCQLAALRTLSLCVSKKWMAILIGNSHSGKTSLVHLLSQLTGQKLFTLSVNSAMDTTELLGGFEQTDYARHLEELSNGVECVLIGAVQKLLLASKFNEAKELIAQWYAYMSVKPAGNDSEYSLSKATDLFLKKLGQLKAVLFKLKMTTSIEALYNRLEELRSSVEKHGIKAGGTFEWVDSILVKCLIEGHWLLIDNVNLCSGSVLDRLNGLLEPNGVLLLGERGVGPEGDFTISPHPNFRLFLAMNPHHGDISRAMRNRGIEVYIDPLEIDIVHLLDLNALLNQAGLHLQEHRNAVINIHKKMLSVSQGIDQPSTRHLLNATYIAVQNWKRGLSLYQSISNAFFDVYLKSRTLISDHKILVASTLQDTISEQKHLLSIEEISMPHNFFSDFSTISTLSLQQNSILSLIKQQGSILHSFIRTCEIVQSIRRNISSLMLKDIVGNDFTRLTLQQFTGLDYRVLETIPFIVTSFYNLASKSDANLRHKWLSELLKTSSAYNNFQNIYNKIEELSCLVSQTILCELEGSSDCPRDWRYILDKPQHSGNFLIENKLSTLMYYKVVLSSSAPDDIDVSNVKSEWKTLSVLKYSELVKKGNIHNLFTDHPLICELTSLLSEFDRNIMLMLASNITYLSTKQCCDLLYNVAWKFRLGNVGKRLLFDYSLSSSNLPVVSEDTKTLLILHYKWFTKYTLPILLQVMTTDPAMRESMSQLFHILEKISTSLDGNNVQLITLSKRMTRNMSQPLPLSSTLQCELSKQLLTLVKFFGIWNVSVQSITEEKINHFVSSKGYSIRNNLIKASQIVFENLHLDDASQILLEVEQFKTEIPSVSIKTEYKNNRMLSVVKFSPLSELLCLFLNTACRRQIAEGRSTDFDVMDSLKSLMQWSTSVSPITAGVLSNMGDNKAFKDIMKVSVILLNQMSYSIAVNNPYEWINWGEKQKDSKEMDISENKLVVYPLHSPLLSLFISGIVIRLNKKEDNCSSALNFYGDTNKLMSLLKKTLWRNMPIIFSEKLDVLLNEEKCLTFSYKNLICLLSQYSSIQRDNSNVPTVDKIVESLKQMIKGKSSRSIINQIINSLTELDKVVCQLQASTNNCDKWLLIGKGWTLMGHIQIFLFANLEPVDPVQKRALKMQYTLQEMEELEKLLCVEEIHKVMLGESGKWPYELFHQNRIQYLKDKTKNLKNNVAVRPCPPLYNLIVKDIDHLTKMVSDSTLNMLMSDFSNTEKENTERTLNELKVMLDSFKRFNDKLIDSYLITYPDIITPPLLAVSQLIHGIHLIGSAVQKKLYQSELGNAECLLEYLSIFPVPDVDHALNIIDSCSSTAILELINQTNQLKGSLSHSDNVFKLTKISLHMVKSIAGSKKWLKFKNSLLGILDNFVISWQKHKQLLEEKKAQKESIYINKMSDIPLTEDEIIREEISQMFPSSHEQDFWDLNPPSLESQPALKITKLNPDITINHLTAKDIIDICDLHSSIVKETATAHWLNDNLTCSKREDYIMSFFDRINIFTNVIDNLYISCDKKLDKTAITGLFMAAGTPVDEILPLDLTQNYDFYRDPNVSEAKKCIPILNSLISKVSELLCEWPDHPTLNQIQMIIDRIKGFSFRSPLSRFLTGIELLLSKLHDWEENAHDGVSLASLSAIVTSYIISWRRLELSAWKGSLHGITKKIQEEASRWWFHLYALVNEHMKKEYNAENNVDFINTLEGFMEGSTLGEFSRRLEFLYTFHCHCIAQKASPQQQVLCSIFWNLYNYYNQFSILVAKRIKDLSSQVEKELKNFVKIARWNDINYWSVKAAVEKTHRTLHKHIKAFEKILRQPVSLAMTKVQDVFEKTDGTTKYNLSYYLSTLIQNTSQDDETCKSPLAKQTILFKKALSLCKKVMTICPYSTLISELYKLIDDISEIGKLLNDFDINPALPADKKRSAAKSLLQKKRKAVSDLFRTLTEIGLAHRTGLIMYEKKNTEFAIHSPINIKAALRQIEARSCDNDWLCAWKNTDCFFMGSISRIAQLKLALVKPHKDLGPPAIERTKGFTSHLMKLCCEQKTFLQKSSQGLFTLRCLVFQISKFKDIDNTVYNENYLSNKIKLIDVLDDIIYCLEQFTLVLEACPDQLNEMEEIPMLYAENAPTFEMILSSKNDFKWESVRNVVDLIIDTCKRLKDNIFCTEKHSLFIKNIWSYDQNIHDEYLNMLDCLINSEQLDCFENVVSKLNVIKTNLKDIQGRFDIIINEKVIKNPLTDSIGFLERKVDDVINKLSPARVISSENVSYEVGHDEIEAKAEALLNKILYSIQEIYKKYFPSNKFDDFSEICIGNDNKGLREGHLKHLLNDALKNDINDLKIEEIMNEMISLVKIISKVDCQQTKLSIQRCLQQSTPLFDQYILLCQFLITQQTSLLKVSCLLGSNLLRVLTDFAHSGYNIPEELQEEGEGEGEALKGGMGLGEGEGVKDVSDQIESEDQLEDARKPDDYNEEEDKDCKEEEKGIEMTDDIGGKLQNIDKTEDDDQSNEKSDNEDEEPDKEMGDTEKGAEALDQQIWGEDSEDEDEDENSKKNLPLDDHDKGAGQEEKEVGAKDDSKNPQDTPEAGEPKQKEPIEKEINEMEDRDIDDEHEDQYHGNMEPLPEPEPFEIEDDLDLDKESVNSDGEETENPYENESLKDTDKNAEEPPANDEHQSKEEKKEDVIQNSDTEEEDLGPETSIKTNDNDNEEPLENQDESEKANAEKEDIQQEETNELGGEASVDKPSKDVVEGSDKKWTCQDQVSQEPSQMDSTDISERQSNAEGKDEKGVGQAQEEQSEIGGHKGNVGKGTSDGTKQREDKRERPGLSEIERSLGDLNEPVRKRLKTMGVGKDKDEGEQETEINENMTEKGNQEADIYQHIHEAKETQHDALTVDAATKEQAEKQPVPNKEEEEAFEEMTEDDQRMDLADDDVEVVNIPKLESHSTKDNQKDSLKEGANQNGEGEMKEDTGIEVEGDYIKTSTVERGQECTYHTRPEEIKIDFALVTEEEIVNIRQQVENQLASWSQPPANSEAVAAWERLCHVTSSLARDLSEQLRLVLEPTTASSLKGDFRTGRRINMRKVIPYIASQFRKDKIWLRRTKPSKREYQIILAVDDSSSMADNHSKELAFESLALVGRALSLLEAGNLSVVSFGEAVQVLHKLGDTFTEHSGARLLQQFSFEQKRTKIGALVDFACSLLGSSKRTSVGSSDIAQLLVIVSDGRGVLSEGEAAVRAAVRRAKHQQIFMVFVIIDNPNSKDSILDIRMPHFKDGKLMEISSYMDNFPFPFYLILRDINNLPTVLSDALRQWFELVTNLH